MKAKVIMLPTENGTGIIGKIPNARKTIYLIDRGDMGRLSNVGPDNIEQHIYLTDPNAEIREHDWFIKDNIIYQCN